MTATDKVLNEINGIYELREGETIELTDDERTKLYELLIDHYNEGYDAGYKDGADDFEKWGK